MMKSILLEQCSNHNLLKWLLLEHSLNLSFFYKKIEKNNMMKALLLEQCSNHNILKYGDKLFGESTHKPVYSD